MKKEEVGHHFLARLGKTRLRPGGKLATDWLIANGDFDKNKKVLEVACNMGTT
ncbi:TPA: SAM-dependent methyltransferase, partial [Mannheimia haemolytica]|nr:SAM-dependent methyltransferase [Mannheimia haemolytica]